MSTRIHYPSSRFQGPTGDARPAAEIFAGIEARQKQAEDYAARLRALLDEIMRDATMMRREGRVDLIRKTVAAWLTENDWRMAKEVEQNAPDRND